MTTLIFMDAHDTLEHTTDEQDSTADEVVVELLVEEVSIDGMCGVY